MATFHPDPGTHRIRRQGIGALFFVGLALVMYFLPPSQQQEVAGLLRASVLRPFMVTQEIVSRTQVQTREAAELQKEMDSLVSVLANQTTLAEENRRLRALLGLERRIGVDYRAASLLRPGTEGSESMFLLQVEGDAAVRSGAPVIAPEGLVGVVREVGSGGAIGMDWTHPDFRASAMTADGVTYGIVEPGRNDQNGTSLILTGTPFTTRIEPGSWIVTSGRGGIYPRGIPIGTVAGLTESEGGWRKTYGVEPAVELGAVTHVLVGVGKTALGPPLPSPDSIVPADTSTEAGISARAEGPVSGAGPVGADTTDLRSIMLEGRFSPGEDAVGDSVAGGGPPDGP